MAARIAFSPVRITVVFPPHLSTTQAVTASNEYFTWLVDDLTVERSSETRSVPPDDSDTFQFQTQIIARSLFALHCFCSCVAMVQKGREGKGKKGKV